MQSSRITFATGAFALFGATNAAYFAQSPVTQVVSLLQELKARVEADGADEQRSYDKYACWCEETMEQKAKDIAIGQQSAAALHTEIVQLNGALGAGGAEVEQLKKDIAANIASQKEAETVRTNERMSYQDEKTESEQCVGALEAAIKALAGAGEGRKGFLETLQETQLMSAAAGIRGMLGKVASKHSVSEEELTMLKSFISKPEDFVGRTSGISAAQIANNPFGDYAPQSTQIQGILKSMYDSFTSDLERSNGEEAVKQKSFQALMEMKRQELSTLEATLRQSTLSEAEKTKMLAEKRGLVDETEAQLTADKVFFEDSKESCRTKAADWSQRTRLRTTELQGFATAISILSDPEAQKTFQNASTTFVQVRSERHHSGLVRIQASLRAVGAQDIANLIATGGHFDQVIKAIEMMIAVLRREEQDDISHRDACEGKSTKNKHQIEDLTYGIEKAGSEIGRLTGSASEVEAKIEALDAQINATETDGTALVAMRTKEHDDFVRAVKDDADAVELLEKAIVTLTKYYRDNGIPIALAQGPVSAAPETTWQSGNYGGRSGESRGIIAILSMIKEDFEKETAVAREEDATAQLNFEKDRKAIEEMLSNQRSTRASLAVTFAALSQKRVDVEGEKVMEEKDLEGANQEKGAIYLDCSWVDTHFEKRRTERKAELDGLTEAKNYLAGVESGSEVP